MRGLVYEWDISINDKGYLDYTLPNDNPWISPIKAMVSQGIRYEGEYPPDCWVGLVLTKDGLTTSSGLFIDIRGALICSEVMLLLDKEWMKWKCWDELDNEDFITSVYFTYILRKPSLTHWAVLISYMNINIK